MDMALCDEGLNADTGVKGPLAGDEGPEEPDPEPADAMEFEGEMMW